MGFGSGLIGELADYIIIIIIGLIFGFSIGEQIKKYLKKKNDN